MSRTDDLKTLLERLKGEVSRAVDPELPPEPPAGYSRPGPAAPAGAAEQAPPPPRAAQSYPPRHGGPQRPELGRPERGPAGANLIWSENKETLLFGMLASLIVLLCGAAASILFLTILGAVSFAAFAAIAALVLYGYSRAFRAEQAGDGAPELAARVEQLARKVESLAVRGASAQASGGFRGGDRDLEKKVEELRMLVKSLAKAVEDK